MGRTTTWKNDELLVGKFFNTHRTPLSGENSRHSTHSDTLHPSLYIETKRRTKHYAVELYEKELPKARAENKPLIIALKQHHQGKKEGAPPFLIVIDPRQIHTISKLMLAHKGESSCLTKVKKNLEVKAVSW